MLIVSISWWFYHLGRRKVLVHGKLYAKLCYMSVAVFLFVVVFLQMSRLQSMFTVRMNERMNLATAPWYYRHYRICLWKWMSTSWVTCYICISLAFLGAVRFAVFCMQWQSTRELNKGNNWSPASKQHWELHRL